ncbi:MAG: SpoIID/LytB domain-containing protein, partial [Eubacteriales bacterium]|nr:SpoIID/LytB domain-containing protein [Eubacteriales bacterium]
GTVDDPTNEDYTPVAVAGADQVVGSGMPINLSSAGSKEYLGAIYGYHWTQVSGPTATHAGADLCDDPDHCRGFTKTKITDNVVLSAVSDTKGRVIRYNGQVIDPIAHISSSVKTESAEYVFGISVPYLVSVETPDESDMTGFYGKKEFSKNEFADILTSNGYTVSNTENHAGWISYIAYTAGGRVKTAYICGNEISGTKLMTMFSLQSANITVSTGENGFVFTTEGIGHGVGLSIYGAWVMAEEGKTSSEIIVHYFSGVYISYN